VLWYSIRRKEFSKKTRIMKEVVRVMRKLMMVLVVLAFACGTMLMMSSCAKKQIGTGEAAPAPAAAAPSAPAAAAAPSTKPVDDADKLRGRSRRSRPRAFTSTMTSQRSRLKQKRSWRRKRLVRANPSYKVKIEGNCDDRAPTSTTWLLATGERRLPRSTSMLLEFPWTG